MTLQKMWPPCMESLALPFLDVSDCCHLEGASKFWRERTLGEEGWQARFLDRFGVNPCSIPGISASSVRLSQKLQYFRFLSWRIVPGERAGAVRIGQEKWQFQTKLGTRSKAL